MDRTLGLVIVAGGSGSRFGAGNKLLTPLGGRPLFLWALAALGPAVPPENRVLVTPAAERAKFVAAAAAGLPALPFRTADGGDCRAASVTAGLAALPPEVEYVAIHDAARPLATAELLAQVLELARRVGGAVPGRPVVDTLKRAAADGRIEATVDRERLFRVETPQIFRLRELREAYRLPGSFGWTDDAAVYAAAGRPVAVAVHDGENGKLTYPGDLAFLEFCLGRRR